MRSCDGADVPISDFGKRSSKAWKDHIHHTNTINTNYSRYAAVLPGELLHIMNAFVNAPISQQWYDDFVLKEAQLHKVDAAAFEQVVQNEINDGGLYAEAFSETASRITMSYLLSRQVIDMVVNFGDHGITLPILPGKSYSSACLQMSRVVVRLSLITIISAISDAVAEAQKARDDDDKEMKSDKIKIHRELIRHFDKPFLKRCPFQPLSPQSCDNYGDDNVFSRDGMIHKFIEKFTCAKKNTLELRLEALEAKSPLTVQELEEKAWLNEVRLYYDIDYCIMCHQSKDLIRKYSRHVSRATRSIPRPTKRSADEMETEEKDSQGFQAAAPSASLTSSYADQQLKIVQQHQKEEDATNKKEVEILDLMGQHLRQENKSSTANAAKPFDEGVYAVLRRKILSGSNAMEDVLTTIGVEMSQLPSFMGALKGSTLKGLCRAFAKSGGDVDTFRKLTGLSASLDTVGSSIFEGFDELVMDG